MTVIVTGAAGVLGGAVCKHLITQKQQVIGMDVVAPEIDLKGLKSMMAGIDLTKAEAVEAAISEHIPPDEEIDGLVNIAGGFVWIPTRDADAATWATMHAMNFQTTLNASRAVLPRLQPGRGSIVNIGAHAALSADTGMGPYAASKAAVAKLTEALSEELKADRIRVNAILPSIIDTPANRKEMPEADFTAWVQPKEIAEVIGFLLSPKASGVTGALLPVVGRV